eukprot:6939058-Pyramimonas_sp.AAC.1
MPHALSPAAGPNLQWLGTLAAPLVDVAVAVSAAPQTPEGRKQMRQVGDSHRRLPGREASRAFAPQTAWAEHN